MKIQARRSCGGVYPERSRRDQDRLFAESFYIKRDCFAEKGSQRQYKIMIKNKYKQKLKKRPGPLRR